MRSFLPVLPLAAASALLACSSQTADADRVEALAQEANARLVSHDYDFGIGEHSAQPVAYPTNPPTNGPHAFDWAGDGNYAGVEPPSPEQIVHAQEHGRVVVQYRQGMAAADVAKLERLYDESPYHVLLVENRTDMPCEVAATAWGRAILCDDLSERSLDAIRAFRDAYRDTGPERVP